MLELTSVSFIILDVASGELYYPTDYVLKRIAKDKSRNVFLEFINPENSLVTMISFKERDIRNLIDILEKTLLNLKRNIEIGWVIFFFPKSDDKEEDIWMCNLVETRSEKEEIKLIFDWIFYKEDSSAAEKEIEEFSNSNEVIDLEKTLNGIKTSTDEAIFKRSVRVLELRIMKAFDVQGEDNIYTNILSNYDKRSFAEIALGFKRSGKYLLRKNTRYYQVILTVPRSDIVTIVEKLGALVK